MATKIRYLRKFNCLVIARRLNFSQMILRLRFMTYSLVTDEKTDSKTNLVIGFRFYLLGAESLKARERKKYLPV